MSVTDMTVGIVVDDNDIYKGILAWYMGQDSSHFDMN
jgi:hypothetical protein